MTSPPQPLYPYDIDDKMRTELRKLLTDTSWKWGYLYGVKGVNQCIRINRNTIKDKQENPLNKINDDNIINKYGGNMMRPYQASFIYYKKQIPNVVKGYYVSHICGLSEEPSIYNKSNWNSCIKPQHMISELKAANLARKRCHRFIRLFRFKYLTNTKKSVTNGIKITVGNIKTHTKKDERLQIIKQKGIKGSKADINKLANHKCECENGKCFITYGNRKQFRLLYSERLDTLQVEEFKKNTK